MQNCGVNDKGRTLVEMIGVLTMMGILTMGAMALYGRANTQLRVNDLLDSCRKRALAYGTGNRRTSSQFTYGMFEQEGHRYTKTNYGYGVGDNKNIVRLNGVTKVPVGKLNDGNKVSMDVCKGLLGIVNENPRTGDVEGVYTYAGAVCSKTKLNTCSKIVEEKEEDAVPDVICIGIKS